MEGCETKNLKITVEGGRSLDFHSRNLLISISDTGKGVADKDIENVYNPFYTTKKDGTGLGLPISYGIISRHGGEMEIESTPGQGSTMVVKLPQVLKRVEEP